MQRAGLATPPVDLRSISAKPVAEAIDTIAALLARAVVSGI
jgi:hypothetical protein